MSISTCWVTVHIKSEKLYYIYMTIPCCFVKRSVLLRVSAHRVTVLVHSKELHNVHVSLPGSPMKWSVVQVI